MPQIDSQLIECLLNMSENDALDFKREQYPLQDTNQKGEFLKDVLAFANAWKQSDAYILVGVAENPGGRATVLGVSNHWDDANLQQLVSAKTNVPVSFSYHPCEVEGRQVGVLVIGQTQERPVFLKENFGKLDANKVYVRRGSSTAIANPEEIARMGQAKLLAAREPELLFELGNPESEVVFGVSAAVTSRLLQEKPSIPRHPSGSRNLPRILGIHGSASILWRDPVQVAQPIPWNAPDPKKVAAYRKEIALLAPLGFHIRNRSDILVQDLRLEMDIPKSDGLRVRDELPRRPSGPLDLPSLAGLTLNPSPVRTWVEETRTHWRIHIVFSKLQPHAAGWSQPFWLGSTSEESIEIVLQVHADNIRKPISLPLSIGISVQEGWLDNEEEDSDS